MKLTTEYLKQRYIFWLDVIDSRGLWQKSKFLPVNIVLKKPSRTCNGKFYRVGKMTPQGYVVRDSIFIYNNWSDPDPRLVDSVLVHEMIHQYIAQSAIKDTSSHGKMFRHFMASINSAFPDSLDLRISHRATDMEPPTTNTDTVFILAMLYTSSHAFCCIIMPGAVTKMQARLKRHHRKYGINRWEWYQSSHSFFSRYRKCRTALHGIKMPTAEVDSFVKLHGMSIIS